MLLLRPPLLQLATHIQQDLVCRPDGIVEVRKGRGPVGLPLEDLLVGLLALHALLDAREIHLMLEVALLEVVELLLARLVGPERALLEQVPELLGFFEDV